MKRSKECTPAEKRIVGHVLNTLPDSLTGRRALLNALSEFLGESDDLRYKIREMMHHLEAHESAVDVAGYQLVFGEEPAGRPTSQ